MQNREPSKTGSFSLGLAHEFVGAYARHGGSPSVMQCATEDHHFMKRLARFMEAGGVQYDLSAEERSAAEILSRRRVINPGMVSLSWPEARDARPQIPYHEDTLKECSGEGWRLVYIQGLSLAEQMERYPNYFKQDWMGPFWESEITSGLMTDHLPSGYYLIDFYPRLVGGADYREKQDEELLKLGSLYERIRIETLTEAAISIWNTFGEVDGERMFGGHEHWSDQQSTNGEFIHLRFRTEGHYTARRLELELSNEKASKSWSSGAFVGRLGMCVIRKSDF